MSYLEWVILLSNVSTYIADIYSFELIIDITNRHPAQVCLMFSIS